MSIEFIQNDKQRLSILEDLAKAELSEEQLAKMNHISLEAVKDALHSMEKEGIVGVKGELHFLTERGRKVALEINKMAHIDASPVKMNKERPAKGDKFVGHTQKRR